MGYFCAWFLVEVYCDCSSATILSSDYFADLTTCLRKSCSFGLPRVPFVNCCQFMYLVISLLVLRAGCGI